MASRLDSLTVAYPRVFRCRAARLTSLEPLSSHVPPLLKTDVLVSHCGQSQVQTPSSGLAFKAFLSRPSLDGLCGLLHSCASTWLNVAPGMQVCVVLTLQNRGEDDSVRHSSMLPQNHVLPPQRFLPPIS